MEELFKVGGGFFGKGSGVGGEIESVWWVWCVVGVCGVYLRVCYMCV